MSQQTTSKNHLGDNILSLRVVSKSGDFEQSIDCFPSQVTYLCPSKDKALQPVCEKLLGKESGAAVDMRFGSHEVHPSEIQVIRSHSVWAEGTVIDALRQMGMPTDVATSLLVELDMADKGEVEVSELGGAKLSLLSAIGARFCPTNFLVFERPFAGVSKDLVEEMGELIIKTATGSGKFVVVVAAGEEMPAAWRESDDVSCYGTQASKKEFGVSREREDGTQDAYQTFKKLLHQNRSMVEVKEEGIVTRPQSIFSRRGRASVPEAVQMEEIPSPHFAELERERTSGKSPPMTMGSLKGPTSEVESRGYAHKKRRREGSLITPDSKVGLTKVRDTWLESSWKALVKVARSQIKET